MEKEGSLPARRYTASGTTAIAGSLHLSLVQPVLSINEGAGYFFLISGILQLIWVGLTLRGYRWAYGIGAGGSIALIVLWAVTRFPNPLTGDALPVNEIGIGTKIMEAAFTGLNISLLIHHD